MPDFLFGGGSETTKEEIPQWLQDASKDAIHRGNAVAEIGYTPYMGPEIAAFNPAQESVFANNRAMATDLGLQATERASMPDAQDFGNGIWGYGSYEPWKAHQAKFAQERPGQAAMIDSFFIDPMTGEAGDWTLRKIAEARQVMQGIPFNERGGHGPDGLEGAPAGYGDGGRGGAFGGGYSGIGDMFDGGGPGKSGGRYEGGGLLSDIGNARNDVASAITGRNPLGDRNDANGKGGRSGGIGGAIGDFFGGIFG